MLNQEHREFLKSEHGRKWIIEKTLEVVPKDKNWQNFHTPYDLCEKMISKTNVEDKSILVLFNIEFLEVLIHKFGVLSKNILFLADCKLESEICSKIYKVDNIIVNDINNIQEVLKTLKHFDLCFSNPPYNPYPSDLKIIQELMIICKEIVVVHPGGWVLDNKSFDKYRIKHKTKLQDKIRNIEFINGNYIFNIKKFCWVSIVHIDQTKQIKEEITVIYPTEQITCQSFDDITIFGSGWLNYTKPFIDLVVKKFEDENIKSISFYDLKTNKPSKTFQCQLANIRGNVECTDPNKIYKDDFFTLIPKNINICKGIRLTNTQFPHIFEFDSEGEVDNFLNYLTTYFVRFCFAIYKIDQNNCEMVWPLIPWLDFEEKWDDQKLYTYFEIPNEIQVYIESFLPDYYNLKDLK